MVDPGKVDELLREVAAAITEITPRVAGLRQAWMDAETAYQDLESRLNALATLRAGLVQVAESIEYPQTGAPTT